MHRVFFGRAHEVSDLVHRVRSPQGPGGRGPLLVIGPSGTGKSSVVRAGLAPAMAGQSGWWVLPPMVPGTDPVSLLAEALAGAAAGVGLGWSAVEVRGWLDRDDGLALAAGDLLRAAPGSGPRRRLLVIVDQFEELLSLTPEPVRERFAALLRTAAAGPVRVVGTLRTDSLDAVLNDRLLTALGPPETFVLQPLTPEALRTVITGPAEVAGLVIDDDLVSRIVEDTGTGDALPLLSFALARLSDGVGRGGRLTATRYQEVGGVRGALTSQADDALTAASRATGRAPQDVVDSLVRWLVTVDDRGQAVGKRAERSALPPEVSAELQVFVEHRLVTTDRIDTDEATANGADDGPTSGVTYGSPTSPSCRSGTRSATRSGAVPKGCRPAVTSNEPRDNGRPRTCGPRRYGTVVSSPAASRRSPPDRNGPPSDGFCRASFRD